MPVLNLGRVVGERGPQGIPGPQGEQGIQGVAGPAGKDGVDGENGAPGKSATIEIGTVTTGEPGTEASVSNSGSANDAVFNFTIPRGEKGERGDQGPAGPTGPEGAPGRDGAAGATGADGKSAYQTAVSGGYTGSEEQFNKHLSNIDAFVDKEYLGDTINPAKKLGLTGDLSVGASLGVLSTAGDLHVWRRTQQVGDKIPAGYNLGESQSASIYGASVNYYYADSVSVSDSGVVSLVSPSEKVIGASQSYVSVLEGFRGKFFYYNPENIYYMDPSCEVTYSGGTNFTFSALKKVIGYPAVPPGTYIDYPVSTNSKSYQEGTGPKSAGYNVGIIVDSKMKFIGYSYDGLSSANCFYAKKLSVTEYGEISLTDKIQYNEISDSGATQANQNLKGSYFYVENNSGGDTSFSRGVIYYIPSNATFSYDSSSKALYVNRYQPVTGYAAIPAGTTIEYLGKLGDKARIVTGSYKGAGTYGIDNPTVLTFDAPPKIVFIQKNISNAAYSPAAIFIKGISCTAVAVNSASSTGTSSTPELSACIVAWKDNTISFYNEKSYEGQLNSPLLTYKYAAIL